MLVSFHISICTKPSPGDLLVRYGGVEFTDARMKFDEFKAKKADGTFPFGQVPALQVRADGDVGYSVVDAACSAPMTNSFTAFREVG